MPYNRDPDLRTTLNEVMRDRHWCGTVVLRKPFKNGYKDYWMNAVDTTVKGWVACKIDMIGTVQNGTVTSVVKGNYRTVFLPGYTIVQIPA